MRALKRIARGKVQPGDIAEHLDGFDGREVARIDPKKNEVYLLFFTDMPVGTFPASNYTYYRHDGEEA